MSVSWMQDWQRNPAEYVKRQLQAPSERNAREVADAGRAAEQERYVKSYAERRPINEPPSAA